MKLISLNVWGGKIYKPLIKFIKEYSSDTDIFCFQEVFKTTSGTTEHSGFRINLHEEFSKILKDYNEYFISTVDNYIAGSFQPDFIDFDLAWGQTIFVSKKIKVNSSGHFFVYGSKETFNPKDWHSFPRVVQYINLEENNQSFTICNVHGIWVKEGKGDTPHRIKQSQNIKEFLKNQSSRKIICGDFNLDMNTKSIEILEEDFINLIRKYNIPTTRIKASLTKGNFADYVFVSPNVNVIDFQVPNLEVADHLPMILEFS